MLKIVGNGIYAHCSNFDEWRTKCITYMPSNLFDALYQEAFIYYEDLIGEKHFVMKFEHKSRSISLISSPDWDIRHEPSVGDGVRVFYDINDNISADLNDDISDNKNNNIKADLNDEISDNIKADLGMYDEEYPDSENDKTKDDEDMSIVDELSDDELKNIEIEDQAAATIDDEETVEKVLRESAGTFSSDVADIQEASRENYRILGTIKE